MTQRRPDSTAALLAERISKQFSVVGGKSYHFPQLTAPMMATMGEVERSRRREFRRGCTTRSP